MSFGGMVLAISPMMVILSFFLLPECRHAFAMCSEPIAGCVSLILIAPPVWNLMMLPGIMVLKSLMNVVRIRMRTPAVDLVPWSQKC